MAKNYGWRSFKHKHHESRFTRFYEDFWLPKRFGYDKRKAHFSSLISTNQMSRKEAISRLMSEELDEDFLKLEFEFIANKLGISINELQRIFELPLQTYSNFRNKRNLIRFGASLMRKLGMERRNI